ncbi:hypothetical protein MNBD_GAMMA10-2337, partial [hydrothermal vent metagenome]
MPMYKFKRKRAGALVQRLTEPPRMMQIVAGPRQTGKTVLVHQTCLDLEVDFGINSDFNAADAPKSSNSIT